MQIKTINENKNTPELEYMLKIKRKYTPGLYYFVIKTTS